MDGRDHTSIWKKEITFRRKAQPANQNAAPAKPVETSVWKKEVSFRRKPKAETGQVMVPPREQPAKPVETSVWKKEVSFRRKPKAETGQVMVPPREQPAKPVETSVWKKEVSFRRKPKAESGQVMVPPREQPAKPAETSFWKKEVTFRRKQKTDTGHVTMPPPEQPALPKPELAVEPPPLSGHPLEPVVPPVPPPIAPPVSPPDTAPLMSSAVPSLSPEPSATPKPESVVEPPPLFARPLEPVVSPPIAPPVSAPSTASPLPSAVPPPPAAPPEPGGLGPESREIAAEVTAPDPAPEVEPAPAEPGPEPESAQPPALSRRDRWDDRRAADRLAKEQRKRTKELAKEDRKANRGTLNRVVGLKIGASQIAAAQVINKGGPRVVRMARAPLGRGVVVGGELREPDELTAALKTFFRKNKLPRTCVRLGISNNRIGVRTFEIAGIEDPKQLANAVRFRAQETLPIPLEEAVLDYRILEEKIGEDGSLVRRVLLVVAHRELVERYAAACRKAGLKLIGIDLEAFALLRALSDPASPPAEDAAVVCVSIGHDRSTLAVSDGRVCDFTRVLAWGGSALNFALARALDLTPTAVEPIKHRLSLGEEGEGAGLDAVRADEARRAMAAELQVFARELVASLRFYQEQPNSLGIVEILVTGGAVACGGLTAELERLTGLPVRVADPFTRVRVPRKLRREESSSTGSLAVAVGLAIED